MAKTVLFVLCILMGFQAQPANKTTKDGTKSSQVPTPQPPPQQSNALKPDAQKGEPEIDSAIKSSQPVAVPQKDNWDRANVIANIGLVLFAAVGSYFALSTLRSTKIAAEAARDANERVIKVDRAWLIVTKADVVTNKPGAPGEMFIQCDVRNMGKTHARLLGLKAILRNGPIGRPEPPKDAIELAPDSGWTPNLTIFPDKGSAVHSPILDFKGSPGEHMAFKCEAFETIYIYGVVYYWDAFTEIQRHTTFCFHHYGINEFGKPKDGFHPIGSSEVNEMT